MNVFLLYGNTSNEILIEFHRLTVWRKEHLPVICAASPDPAVAEACQEDNYLGGLAQAHLVSQNPPHLLAVQLPQPPHTCLLVPARREAGGERANVRGRQPHILTCLFLAQHPHQPGSRATLTS